MKKRRNRAHGYHGGAGRSEIPGAPARPHTEFNLSSKGKVTSHNSPDHAKIPMPNKPAPHLYYGNHAHIANLIHSPTTKRKRKKCNNEKKKREREKTMYQIKLGARKEKALQVHDFYIYKKKKRQMQLRR